MDINEVRPQQNYFLQHSKIEKPKKEDLFRSTDKVDIGSGKEAGKKPWTKEWTFLHYTAADNDLKQFLVSDVNEMEVVGSTAQMNLVVQLDTGKNCNRYYLERDPDPKVINSQVLESMGPVNMSDPKTLADFVKFGMEKYPAKHYVLIIGDHGGGWSGAVQDESHNGWMTTPQIREALETAQEATGKKLDVLGFDACLMANSEVVKELEGLADYMVGSEQVEGGNGWSYTPLLTPDKLKMMDEALKKRAKITPEVMAKGIVEISKQDQKSIPTLSAMDMKKIDGLVEAKESLAKSILESDTSGALMQRLARQTENFYGLKDLFHYAENIVKSEEVTDEKMKQSAQGVMNAVKDIVIAEQHDPWQHPNANGLTAEIPSYGGIKSSYKDLKFAKETMWDEAMEKINRGARAEGATAEAIEIPKMKEEMVSAMKEIGSLPGFDKIAELANDAEFVDSVGKSVSGMKYFEEMVAGEPNFAEDKGKGIAGLLVFGAVKGMVNMSGDIESFKTTSKEFINAIIDNNQFGAVNSQLYHSVIDSIEEAMENQEQSTVGVQAFTSAFEKIELEDKKPY